MKLLLYMWYIHVHTCMWHVVINYMYLHTCTCALHVHSGARIKPLGMYVHRNSYMYVHVHTSSYIHVTCHWLDCVSKAQKYEIMKNRPQAQ